MEVSISGTDQIDLNHLMISNVCLIIQERMVRGEVLSKVLLTRDFSALMEHLIVGN